MNIKLYPHFNEVFIDQKLKGIFYPLCSLIDKEHPENQFHFVSSNGLWIDEQYTNEQNTFEYSLFKIIEGKYSFNGDIRLYKGFNIANSLFLKLELDFKKNGSTYLKDKIEVDEYVRHQFTNSELPAENELDFEYFAQTFYEYSINKLNYELTGKFGSFRQVIDGWASPDKESPIIYSPNTEELLGSLNQYEKPVVEDIENYKIVGQIIGHEFFADGNDTLLFFNKNKNSVLSANSYS